MLKRKQDESDERKRKQKMVKRLELNDKENKRKNKPTKTLLTTTLVTCFNFTPAVYLF